MRRRELAGLAIGIAVGLGVAVAWPITHSSDPPSDPAVAQVAPELIPRPQAASVAAALDTQWAGYSARSSCADWAGGDGVSAVRLNRAQIAWFFSDTYLGPAGPDIGFSRSSGFLNNAVVVQTAASTGSRFVTLTGGGACDQPGHASGEPAPVVAPGVEDIPGDPGDRYWDEDGLLIGGTVVKFYNRYLPGGVPFVPSGTVVAAFRASALGAAGRGSSYGATIRPSVTVLPAFVPPGGGTPVVWGAALLRVGGMVYVYGTQTPAGTTVRQLYLARAPASRLTDFTAWKFYAGAGTWAATQAAAQPVQSSFAAASGFSVISVGHGYWLIQAGADGDIDAYPAATPWGPFGQAIELYRDNGIGLDVTHDYRIMYEARVEPALSSGSTLVLSYNVNSAAVTTGCVPLSVYTNTVTQPRFITVPVSMLDTGAPSGATAGPSDYPSIVARDPGQWFNGWSYPDGCPPLPALPWLHTVTGSSSVVLSWPAVGLGVKYQVYLQRPGAPQASLATTALSATTRLSGLSPGTYVVQVVPVNFRKAVGLPVRVTFTIP
jgi:hypothetical protein